MIGADGSWYDQCIQLPYRQLGVLSKRALRPRRIEQDTWAGPDKVELQCVRSEKMKRHAGVKNQAPHCRKNTDLISKPQQYVSKVKFHKDASFDNTFKVRYHGK